MDVIVVGCGASGLAAIRKLHDAGLKVMGLEAADRIGGRICTIQHGGRSLDIGAAWCHGEKDNAVFEIVNPLGLLAWPKPDHKWYILSNGELLPNAKSEEIIGALNDEVAKADKNNKGSLIQVIKKALNSNKTLKADPLAASFVEWFERNNHIGGQSDPKTGKSLRGLEECLGCEGEFMLNWKGKGFKTFLDVLLNKYPDQSKEIPVQILLNKEVQNIRWRPSQSAGDGNPLVQIKCKDGSLYASKSVIVTLSVDVLKETQKQIFSPALPAEKVNSINNIHLCLLDKIYIEFAKPWWPETPGNFSILWREEDKAIFSADEKWVTDIYGFNTVEYHPNLLLAWIYGDGAKMMEKVSQEKVVAGVNKLLDVIFRKKFDVSPVKTVVRTQWGSNPLIRGTYSYRSVATEENGASSYALSTPLEHDNGFPVVCFAGEATSHNRFGAVHGAVEAGFREANRLITSLKTG